MSVTEAFHPKPGCIRKNMTVMQIASCAMMDRLDTKEMPVRVKAGEALMCRLQGRVTIEVNPRVYPTLR